MTVHFLFTKHWISIGNWAEINRVMLGSGEEGSFMANGFRETIPVKVQNGVLSRGFPFDDLNSYYLVQYIGLL